jgi:uncharacterized pyridoxamine 5'-phosphate oxidase family protein
VIKMTDREKVYQYIEDAGLPFFATVNGDKPACRPFGFRMLVDDQIYFLTVNVKDVAKQLETNPNIQVVASKEGTFLRYSGVATFTDDEALLEKAFEKMPILKDMTSAPGLEAKLFYLDNAVAEFRTAGGESTETIEF